MTISLLIASAGFFLGLPSKEEPAGPMFHMRNSSPREYTVVPMVHSSKAWKRVGVPLVLPNTGSGKKSVRFFPHPGPGDRFILSIRSRSGFQFLELKLNGSVLGSAGKSGVDVSFDKRAVLVRLGSRRQRYLLLPDPKGPNSKTGA